MTTTEEIGKIETATTIEKMKDGYRIKINGRMVGRVDIDTGKLVIYIDVLPLGVQIIGDEKPLVSKTHCMVLDPECYFYVMDVKEE